MKPPTNVPAFVFLLSSALASAGSYAVQFLASSRLEPRLFSDLTTWFFYISVSSIGGVLLQYETSLRTNAQTIQRTHIGMAGVLAIGLSVVAMGQSGRWSGVILGALAVLSQFGFGFLFGTFQRNAQLGTLSLLNISSSIVRVGVAWFGGTSVSGFQASVVCANLAAVAVGSTAVVLSSQSVERKPEQDAPRVSLWSRLLGAAILTSVGLVFPYADFLIVRYSNPAHDTGQFASTHLLARVVFFAGTMLLQVTYPLELRAASGDGAAKSRLTQYRGLAGVGLAVVTGGVLFGQDLVSILFHRAPPTVPKGLLLILCFNFVCLIQLQGLLQMSVAKRQMAIAVKLAGTTLLWLFVLIVVASWLRLDIMFGVIVSGVGYLAIAVVFYRIARSGPSGTVSRSG